MPEPWACDRLVDKAVGKSPDARAIRTECSKSLAVPADEAPESDAESITYNDAPTA